MAMEMLLVRRYDCRALVPTCDVNRETVFFVLLRQETVLRCCGGGVDEGGQWTGRGAEWRLRRRPQWRRRRTCDGVSFVDTTDGRRQEYRRVSGRTSSSIELPADNVHGGCVGDQPGSVVAAAATTAVDHRSSAVGLTDCWRRTLMRRSGGGPDRSSTQREMSTGSTAGCDDDEDDDVGGAGEGADSTTPPAQYFRHPASDNPMALSSNWTMVSNSSLRDVDGEDLRNELVGYADAADHYNGVKVSVVDEYY